MWVCVFVFVGLWVTVCDFVLGFWVACFGFCIRFLLLNFGFFDC